jgi:hypothetical protein
MISGHRKPRFYGIYPSLKWLHPFLHDQFLLEMTPNRSAGTGAVGVLDQFWNKVYPSLARIWHFTAWQPEG